MYPRVFARLSHRPLWRGLGARSAWPRSPAPAARRGSQAGRAAGSSLQRSCAFLSSTRPAGKRRGLQVLCSGHGAPKALHPWDSGQRSWSLWAGPLLFRYRPSATALPLELQDNHGPDPSATFAAHCLGAEGSDKSLKRWRLELPRQLRGEGWGDCGPLDPGGGPRESGT